MWMQFVSPEKRPPFVGANCNSFPIISNSTRCKTTVCTHVNCIYAYNASWALLFFLFLAGQTTTASSSGAAASIVIKIKQKSRETKTHTRISGFIHSFIIKINFYGKLFWRRESLDCDCEFSRDRQSSSLDRYHIIIINCFKDVECAF